MNKNLLFAFVKKTLLSFVLVMLLFPVYHSNAQITFDNIPPLSGGGNTAGGVCFNFTTNQSITVNNLRNAFSTTTGTCNIWYNPNKINGQPTITTANGWVNLGTASFAGLSTATASPVAQTIPIPLNLVMQPGDTFGFAIQWTGNVYPTTNTNTPTFTNGTVTIIADASCAYTFNSAMTTFFTPRQINGGVIYTLNAFSPNDAGVSALVSPSNFCTGPNDIKVKVKNYGNNVINSVQVQWSMNGIPQTPVSLTLPLDTFGGTGLNEREVTLATGYTFTTAPAAFKAWTHLPNSLADTSNINDTLTTTLQSSLSGTYTINSAAPTAGTNYQTFGDFIDDLNTYGVCGPVIANVNSTSGPYTEQLIFEDIAGTSAVNTIRINGNGRTIQYNCDVNSRQLIQLIGTKYVTIDSLNFISQNATYGWAAVINSGASHDSITNCTFDMTATTSTASASTSGICFTGSLTAVTTAGANATHCYIGGNTIMGPTGSGGYYYALTMTSGADSNIVENNKFLDYYFYGVYLSAARYNKIVNNEMARPTKTAVTTFYGLYTTGATDGTLVLGNKIHSPGGTLANANVTAHGLYLLGTGTTTEPCIIANNAIYNMNSGGLSYGIYLSSATNTKILHNTVVYDQTTTGTSNQAGVWLLGTNTNLELKNNNISITGGNTGIKYGINYTTAVSLTSIADAQRNNIYVNSTQSGGQWYAANPTATTFANLAAFQTANPTLEIGSISVNPQFTNAVIGNLLPTNPALQANGLNLGGQVNTDIIGVLRGTLPTPGAWEIPAISGNDGGIQALVSPTGMFCAGQQSVKVSIINSGSAPISNFQVHWTLNGIPQTSYTYSTTLPVFGAGQHIDTITLGNPMFATGNSTIKAWIVVANDVSNLNDSLNAIVSTTNFVVGTASDSLCSGSNAHLNLSPSTGYSTGMLQWQISTNGTTFTDIAGANLVTLTSSNITANRWFRVRVTSASGVCYSNNKAIYVVNPQVIATAPGFTCGSGSVQLGATPNPGSSITWYTTATGGTSVGTGSMFTTPNISANTTYYASAKSGGGGGGNVPELIYYSFEQPSATSVINHASTPVSATGTVLGTATVGGTGQFNTALLGSGALTATNSVNANWPLSLSGAWTLSMWVSGVTSTATSNYLFGGSGGSTFRAMTGTGLVSGGGNLLVRGTGLTDIPVNGIFDATGTPVVVHIVYNPTIPAALVYVNGVFSSQVTQTATLALTGTDFSVGGYATNNGLPTGGKMDEFRLYNRALSAAEIGGSWNAEFGGCESARVPVLASVNTIPTVNLGPDVSVCTNGTTTHTFNAGSQTGATYLWDNGATTPTRVVNATGNYSVALTINGCVARDTVHATFNNNPVVNLGNDTAICLGYSLNLNAGNPGASYLWENGSTSGVRLVNTAGTYSVAVTDANNCVGRDSLTLLINQAPQINLGADTLICDGDTITLNTGYPGLPTLWDNSSTGQTRDVSGAGTYYVFVSESNCVSTDTITIGMVPNPQVSGINAVYGDTATYTFYPINAANGLTYNWNFGDGSPIATGYQVQHTFATNGVFNVSLTIDGQCADATAAVSRTVDVFDAKATGISKKELDNIFTLYPNPAKQSITLESLKQPIQAFNVYNVLGQLVYKQQLSGSQLKCTINTTPMSSGMYTIHLELRDGTKAVRKFEVIQ